MNDREQALDALQTADEHRNDEIHYAVAVALIGIGYAVLDAADAIRESGALEERIRRLEEADEVDGLADRIEAIERMLLADEEAIER